MKVIFFLLGCSLALLEILTARLMYNDFVFIGDIKIPRKILGNKIYKEKSECKEDSTDCPVCNKNITKSNLKRHIKRFHKAAKIVSNKVNY